MDQVLVDVIQLQLLEGELEGFLRVLDFRAGDFGGDVEFLSGDACFFDGFAELGFVAVYCGWLAPLRADCMQVQRTFCAVEVVVSSFDRHHNGFDKLFIFRR